MPALSIFFFFNDTATTEIYTLSLHDALPIFDRSSIVTRSQYDGKLKRSSAPRLSTRCTVSVSPSSRRRSCARSEEHTSELQSPDHLVCRLLLEKKKKSKMHTTADSQLAYKCR